MLSVPVFNMTGDRTGEVEIDPAVFGSKVRVRLIKQAVVAFLDHQRQHSARTKGRSDVEGSTRKLYRQKGTGNARVGASRTPVRRGGGRAFARRGPRRRKVFPKQMRRLARDSAILAKVTASEVVIVDGLHLDEVKTKSMASMFSALGVGRGCVLATDGFDRNVFLSGRNIPRIDIRIVDELSAYEILRRPKLIFSKKSWERLVSDRGRAGANGSGK